ncbi:MAG: helix-turn-helix transcriptional regulator [Clostridia bacterium]|nr:helix-turn-helix transcriptional regulator [Clostridia bacterium]
MYNTIHYGRIVRNYRERARMTIEEAAEKYGISTAGLEKIELGISDPKLSTVLKIAYVLKIDMGILNTCVELCEVLCK